MLQYSIVLVIALENLHLMLVSQYRAMYFTNCSEALLTPLGVLGLKDYRSSSTLQFRLHLRTVRRTGVLLQQPSGILMFAGNLRCTPIAPIAPIAARCPTWCILTGPA